MDNLALSLSKSITGYLEQNETRFLEYGSQQEKHEKLLNDINKRVEQTETQWREILAENKKLKDELEVVKSSEEAAKEDIIIIKNDLKELKNEVRGIQEWVKLMSALTHEVKALKETRPDDKIDELIKSQADLKKQFEKQKQQLRTIASTAQAAAATAASASVRSSTASTAPHYNIKIPSRSPSTASFFNGDTDRLQSSTPRCKPKTNHLFNNNTNLNSNHLNHDHHNHRQFRSHDLDYSGSIDALSEMSDLAENLMDQVHEMNGVSNNRSFRGGSMEDD